MPSYPIEVKLSGEMPDHVCSCGNCCWWLDSTMPQSGPGHFSLRFHKNVHANVRVYKAGEGFIRDCFEVLTGEHGFAWRHRLPYHICRECRQSTCCYIDLGHFIVEKESDHAQLP